jgi:glycosyltransferase involved in cell wall biosynthesis
MLSVTVARIALYTDSKGIGGAEAVLGTLLAELDGELEVVVVGTQPAVVAQLAERRPGVETRILPRVSRKSEIGTLLGNIGRIRSLDVQIFQANLPVPSSCQYALAAATLVPRLRTIAVEHLPYPLDGALQLRLKRFTSSHLSAHVAVGDRVARRVEELVALPPRSVTTIYNGVPDIQLEPTARPFDSPILGSLGRLDRQKGYDVLLRALMEVPDAALVLVGDGSARVRLEAMTSELGLSDRVLFTGWDPNPRRWLTAFDVFVLPSRFEGLPLAIVEAMLARLPVVATDVGSVAEAVTHNVTGLLVQPDDGVALARALRSLLENSGRTSRMGAVGREHALRFTPAAMARSYERLYQELAA